MQLVSPEAMILPPGVKLVSYLTIITYSEK
jgi:hypothetical protein